MPSSRPEVAAEELGSIDTDATTADVLAPKLLGAGLSPGEFVGRYRVQSMVGEGGMGVVYMAQDPALQRHVAVKLLHRGPTGRSRSMVLDEAQALGKLQHPNVVPVFDVGESDGRWFIAMEFVDGCGLGKWCEGKPWTQTVDRFIESARGLAAAHAVGLVHRDFKPANVLVGTDGRARVVDFGLAGPEGGLAIESDTLDRLGASPRGVAGTLAYMAPEQLEGASGTAGSDQFAFFVSLFKILEGRRPFTASDARTHLRLRKLGAPTLTRSDLPRRLVDIVARGLSYDPDDRHDSMQAVVEALLALRHRASRGRRWFGGAVALAMVFVGAMSFTTEDSVCMDRAAAAETVALGYHATLEARLNGTLPAESVEKLAQRVDRYTERAVNRYRAACRTDNLAAVRCLDRRLTGLEHAVEVVAQAQTAPDRVMAVLLEATPTADCAPSDASRPRVVLGAPVAALVDGWNAQAASLYQADRYDEGLRLLEERREDIERFGSVDQQAYHRYIHGLLVGMNGNTSAGLEALSSAHALASSAGNDALAATISTAVLRWSPIFEAPAQGDAWIKRAEADVERSGDPRLRARFLAAAGWYESQRGRHGRAIQRANAATEALADLSDAAETAWRVESLLGMIALTRRDLVSALVHYERALDLLDQLGGSSTESSLEVRSGIAQALLGLGELEQAQLVIDDYDSVGSEEKHRVMRGILRAELQQRSGDEGAALRTLRETSRGLPTSNANWPSVMSRIGLALLRRAEHAEARELFERIRVHAETTYGPDHIQTMIALHNLAEAEAGLHEYERAIGHYREALAIIERTDPNASSRAFPLTGLGEAALALGKLDLARSHLEEALTIPLAEPAEQAEIQAALARTLWKLGDPEFLARALVLAQQAGAKFEDSPAHAPEALALNRWRETL